MTMVTLSLCTLCQQSPHSSTLIHAMFSLSHLSVPLDLLFFSLHFNSHTLSKTLSPLCNVSLLLGPVERTGATKSLVSIYFLDPDGNLLEVSNAL